MRRRQVRDGGVDLDIPRPAACLATTNASNGQTALARWIFRGRRRGAQTTVLRPDSRHHGGIVFIETTVRSTWRVAGCPMDRRSA